MLSYKSRRMGMVFSAGGVRTQRKKSATVRVKARNGTGKLKMKGLGRTFQMATFGHFDFLADSYTTGCGWYKCTPTQSQ